MEPPWPASARGDSWMRGEGCGIGSGWLRGERGSRLLPGVTALTHLSLHHNLSGNAGHLTVCHCVGASLLLGFKSIECPRLILLPKEETGPPVARVLSCQTWWVWNDLPSVLRTATGTVAGCRSYAPSVVIMGGDK